MTQNDSGFDQKCRIRGRIRSLNSDLTKFYSQFCPNVGQICLKNDFFWPYSAFEYLKFEKSNKFVRADKSKPHQKYFLKKRFLFSSNLKFHFLLESQRKKYHWYRWSSLFPDFVCGWSEKQWKKENNKGNITKTS